MAEHNYNVLGQLVRKNVGGSTGGPLQNVDYTYNIRGWLTGINPFAIRGTLTDLFSFRISYDAVEYNLDGAIKPLYNGNISETRWKSSSDNIWRKYGYACDDQNRMKQAYYQKPESEVIETYAYNEGMSYDRNGNITYLGRYGGQDANYPVAIDQLYYTYDAQNPNRLMKIQDTSNSPQGFKDSPTNTTDDYAYDANGNMIRDNNKGITSISYNHMNLPVKLVFGAENKKIEYLYDASGEKISKKVTNGTSIGVVEYMDGFQYKGAVLGFFPTAEGYVQRTAPKGREQFNYVYNYTDHLGNVRVSYTKDPLSGVPKIVEESHYYPFGLKHTNYNSDVLTFQANAADAVVLDFLDPVDPLDTPLTYQYKYNGKEFQDDLALNLYDYGARNYDPAIGRWMNIDPLAEQMRRWSPYNYGFDNPMRFIDPDGMGPNDVIITGNLAKEAFKQLQASTNYQLSFDKKSGKVTTGDLKKGATATTADNKLKDATIDTNITVKVNATDSNYTNTGNWFVGGAYDGSVKNADGTVTANQTINPEMTGKIDKFYGVQDGVSVLHEVLEAYIGGQDSPGVGAPTFADVQNNTPTGTAYVSAHKKTDDLDSRHVAPNTSLDPAKGVFISKFIYGTVPEKFNPEMLINNLKK